MKTLAQIDSAIAELEELRDSALRSHNQDGGGITVADMDGISRRLLALHRERDAIARAKAGKQPKSRFGRIGLG